MRQQEMKLFSMTDNVKDYEKNFQFINKKFTQEKLVNQRIMHNVKRLTMKLRKA